MTTDRNHEPHDGEPKTAGEVPIRRLFGQAVRDRLAATSTRQEDLVARLREVGLVGWDPSAFSRIIQGKRGVQLEEAIILCAALEVPLHLLLVGAETVTLPGGHRVGSAQLRDVVQHGVVQADNAGSTVLDELTAGKAQPTPMDEVAAQLGITVDELDDRALTAWDLPFLDELQRRMARSQQAFTGQDPRTLTGVVMSLRDPPRVTARQSAGWLGHHLRRMTEELRNS